MIFYFSGTGNTRWAAQKVAEATGDRLLFIPDELKGDCSYSLVPHEPVGFCFPVHGWQPPHIVREFIRRLKLTSSFPLKVHFCYALVTCGDSIGRTMNILSKELATIGLGLNSCFSLIMPESYVCLPFMYTDTPAREREKIEKATADLEQYSELIVKHTRNERHIRRGLTPWTFSHVFGAYFNAKMISDRKFTVDADSCIHCGRCQKSCPVGDVTLVDGLPQWHHDGSCTNCLACYHYCPQHAINYGNITRKRGQYYFGHDEQLKDSNIEN
jgi:ferredoxin